jgi:lipopolysaccharide export system permease protein
MGLKVYERYLAREIYAATALVLLAFLMLFGFFDLIHEFEDIGKGGYQLQHAAGFVLLSVPGHSYELFPIAVLIGTLYALTLLAHHSEIMVLRTAGLSTVSLLVTLAKVGMTFIVLTFLIGEYVAPPAEKAAQQLRLKALSSMVAQEFRSGLWIKDEMSFVNVRYVLPTRIYAASGFTNSTSNTSCGRSAMRRKANSRLPTAGVSAESCGRCSRETPPG